MCDVIIAVAMTYYVRFGFCIVLSFFLRFYSLDEQLSRYKSTRKPTQRITQRLIFLIIGSGTLTGKITSLFFFFFLSSKVKFVTATVAMISLILFLLPGHPLYFSSTIGILGKVYSTTMMVVLNNRIVIRTQDESITLDEPLVFSMSNPGITSSTSA